MNIPGLGKVTKDNESDWYYSEPVSVPVLGGKKCKIVIEGYDEDVAKEEFHAAIQNFLSINESVLTDAESYVFQYYKYCNDDWEPDDEEFLTIETPEEVWRHVQFGNEPLVSRRPHGEKGIYVSLDSG